MKTLNILLSIIVLLLIGCTEPRYDNPLDPANYDGSTVDNAIYIDQNLPNTPIALNEGDNLQIDISWNGHVKEVNWYKDGSYVETHSINDQSNYDSFYKESVQAEHIGQYYCELVGYNSVVVNSNSVQVNVNTSSDDVSIHENLPTGTLSLQSGTELTLTVGWNGYAKEVRWIKDGSVISGNGLRTINGARQNDTYAVTSVVSGEHDGEYYCIIIDSDDNPIESNRVTVQINDGPSITNGPDDLTDVALNTYVKFGVALNGVYDSLKWYKDDVYLEGNPTSGNDTLEISDVGLIDAGTYYCRVWFNGESGYHTSNDAQLSLASSIVSNMVFQTNLPDQLVFDEGSDATFTVSVRDFTGSEATFSWYLSDDNIQSSDDTYLAGGPSNQYTIFTVSLTDHGGKYIYSVVEDDLKDITSNLCRILVNTGSM